MGLMKKGEWDGKKEKEKKAQWRVIKKKACATRDVINARANHAEARLA